jgi:ABC-type glycerol-3-phosphate transport system substrate-binding protein
MNMRRIFVGAIASAAVLAACGGPSTEDIDASLKAATASALPGSDYDSIQILNSELFPAKWVWQATVDGKAYACDADNRMRLPSCQATS